MKTHLTVILNIVKFVFSPDVKIQGEPDQYLDPSINTTDSTQTEFPAMTLESPNQPVIIILTYMRSGSSLTGDILQQHPSSFYIFEPLHRASKTLKDDKPFISQGGESRWFDLCYQIRMLQQQQNTRTSRVNCVQSWFSFCKVFWQNIPDWDRSVHLPIAPHDWIG